MKKTPNPSYYGKLKRGIQPPYYEQKDITFPSAEDIQKDYPDKKADQSFVFREGQEEIVTKALQKHTALIVAPTGFGKSIIAMNLIENNEKVFILCHSLELIVNFEETLKQYNLDVGVYAGSIKETGRQITLVHHNTYSNNYTDIFRKLPTDKVIIDECHRFFSKNHQKVLKDLINKRCKLYAFTATPNVEAYDEFRKGMPPILEDVYINRIDAQYDIKDSPLEQVYYTVYQNPPYYDKDYQDLKIELVPVEWTKYKECMLEDENRKESIRKFIKDNITDSDHVVVLMDRIEELTNMSEYFLNSKILHGRISKKNRKEGVKSIREEPGILFGQTQAAGTGLDIPKCNKVFLICSTKSRNTTIQAIGRATRILNQKKSSIYIFGDRAISRHYKNQLQYIGERYPHIKQLNI